MLVCDICKNESKHAKDFGVNHTIMFDEEKIDVCQDCYCEAYIKLFGKDATPKSTEMGM